MDKPITSWYSRTGDVLIGMQPAFAARLDTALLAAFAKQSLNDPTLERFRDHLRDVLKDVPPEAR